MTELHAVAETTQGAFEGMPIESYAFGLKSAGKLYTDAKISPNSHVSGTWEGRVKGVLFQDGKRVHLVEVLDATLQRD